MIIIYEGKHRRFKVLFEVLSWKYLFKSTLSPNSSNTLSKFFLQVTDKLVSSVIKIEKWAFLSQNYLMNLQAFVYRKKYKVKSEKTDRRGPESVLLYCSEFI